MKSTLLLLSLLALPAAAAQEPTLYGRYEFIKVMDIGKTLKAKMDTGALTASLSAKDIERFSRDGEDWVRFRLAAEGADKTLYEHKLARISKIKSRAEEGDDEDDDPTRRPVVELMLCLGGEKRTVEVNLADRSRFNYPLLIGAQALEKFDAAINPARKFTADKPSC
ncbi:MAG: ATP-dependent zinc protease [Pseudomonadota bacterium]